MKKTILTLLIASASLLGGHAQSAPAQLQRMTTGEYIDAPTARPAAGGMRQRIKSQALPGSNIRLKAPSAKVQAKTLGTLRGTFEGLKSWPATAAGWYSFGSTGRPVAIWTGNVSISTGFEADGVLYGFWHRVDTEGYLLGMGLVTAETATGNALSSIDYPVDGTFDRVVWAAAYNADEGAAYLLCSQKNNPNAYCMRKYNPATGAFADVADLPSSTLYPMCMAWNPRNGGIYMIDEYAYLNRFNAEQGSFRRIGDTGLALDDEYGYPGSMIYSPLDEKFVALIETDTYTSFYTVDPLTASSKSIASLNDDSQWLVLSCTDSTADPIAPGSLSNVKAVFEGASLSGVISATMPSSAVGGTALSGTVYVRISAGTATLVDAYAATAGANVEIPLTLAAGEHTLAVTAYVKANGTEIAGPATRLKFYVGYDMPGEPQGVLLDSSGVYWDAAPGVNGGIVDVANVRYNVYVDGVLQPGSPTADTWLATTLPATGNITHVASVEAVSGSYTGPMAYSEPCVAQPPFALPCAIEPLPGDDDLPGDARDLFFVLDVNHDGRTWIYDEQKEKSGGFYYLCHSDNDGDDWLVLPQMTFATPGFYRFSAEMRAGFNNSWFDRPETFEIGLGTEAYAPSLRVISERTTFEPGNGFQPYELIFRIDRPGNYHIGIHCVSPANYYRLYARRFHVERVSGSASPAAATGLSLAPGAEGSLTAIATFTLPAADTEGQPLAADALLTATVTTNAGAAQTTGKPGQTVTATVPAEQGFNTVAVRVADADGNEGPVVSAEVYVGVSVPGTVNLSKTITSDNRTLTLQWTLPATAPDGGYVDPATCSYTVMQRLGSSWRAVADAGTGATEWSFTVPADAAQEVYAFGIMPSNVAGEAEQFAYTTAVLGKLYQLPMNETFRSSGENVITAYDPIEVQNVAEQYCSWSFVDPADMQYGLPNATATALLAYYQGYGQITLPRFSTADVDNIRVTVSMLHGTMSSSEVVIAAITPDNSFLPVETVDLTQSEGWQKTTVTLPAAALGKGWAALAIRCYNPTQMHTFMMDGYTVEYYDGQGLNVESVAAPTKLRVGRTATVTATLANYSAHNMSLPALDATFTAEDGTVMPMEAADDYSGVQIGRGQKVDVSFTLAPQPEHLGYGKARIAIADPLMVDAQGAASARVNIVKGYTPMITDLAVTEDGDGNISLTWSHLQLVDKVTETVEDLAMWERGEQLGDFANYDYDLQQTYAISEFAYPGKYEPKAFEVFAGSEFTGVSTVGDLLQAFNGDNYLMVFSPNSRAVIPGDDWLISPRIAGGTQLSFYMRSPDITYGAESIEVMTSTTDADSGSFALLTTFTTSDTNWNKYTVSLPSDARYFALHYNGFDRFCLMFDDIAFTPYECSGTVTGYKVYRDGQHLDTTAGNSHSHANAGPATYHVTPLITVADGTVVEGLRSNAVKSGSSAVNDVTAATGIKAVKGGVLITGYAGATATVATPDGRIAAATLGEATTVALHPGLYIVSVADTTAKIIVK